MPLARGTEYLSPEQLLNLKEHKYSSRGSSISEKYFQVFWRSLVPYIPKRIAPNTLTLTGLILNTLSVLILLYYSPDLKSNVPSWALVLAAVCIFIYQTLDALDGKHARETNTASPLGELFDHGCDAVASIFVPLCLCVTVGIGTHPVIVFIQFFTFLAMFYLAHWQCYITGYLEFGKIDVTEGQVGVMGTLLFTAIFGVEIWTYRVPLIGMPLKFLPFLVILLAAMVNISHFFTVLSQGGAGKAGTTVAGILILVCAHRKVSLYETSYEDWRVVAELDSSCTKVNLQIYLVRSHGTYAYRCAPTDENGQPQTGTQLALSSSQIFRLYTLQCAVLSLRSCDSTLHQSSLMLPRTRTPLASFKLKKRGLCDLTAFLTALDLTFAVDNSNWIRAGLVSPALNTSVLFPGVPFGVVMFFAIMVAVRSPLHLYTNHLVLFLITFGFVAVKFILKLVIVDIHSNLSERKRTPELTMFKIIDWWRHFHRLMIDHMTKGVVSLRETALIGPMMLFFNQYFNCPVPEFWVLWSCMVIAVADVFLYSANVCVQIANYLNIYIFRVDKPPPLPSPSVNQLASNQKPFAHKASTIEGFTVPGSSTAGYYLRPSHYQRSSPSFSLVTALPSFGRVYYYYFSSANLFLHPSFRPLKAYSPSYYMQYMTMWPEYMKIAESPVLTVFDSKAASVLGGRIMGYMIAKSEGVGKAWHGHVTALSVAPEYRRMGLASRLMKKCVFTDLFVRASNKLGNSVYAKLGYIIYRRVLSYYSGGEDGEDAFDMRKALTADKNRESVIPLTKPVTVDELEFA
ncbi:hypothetical protein ACTXT7_008098 [Hymenolepis weldensis]